MSMRLQECAAVGGGESVGLSTGVPVGLGTAVSVDVAELAVAAGVSPPFPVEQFNKTGDMPRINKANAIFAFT